MSQIKSKVRWVRLKGVVHEGPVIEEDGDFDYRVVKFYCVKCEKPHIFKVEYDILTDTERKVLIKNVVVRGNE